MREALADRLDRLVLQGLAAVGAVSIALLVGWGVWALGSWTWESWKVGDPGRARSEIARFYEQRATGRYEISRCRYVQDASSSDYDNYECLVRRRCRGLSFSVPRADTVARGDRDAFPNFSPWDRC